MNNDRTTWHRAWDPQEARHEVFHSCRLGVCHLESYFPAWNGHGCSGCACSRYVCLYVIVYVCVSVFVCKSVCIRTYTDIFSRFGILFFCLKWSWLLWLCLLQVCILVCECVFMFVCAKVYIYTHTLIYFRDLKSYFLLEMVMAALVVLAPDMICICVFVCMYT